MDKPAGISSHDVVVAARRAFAQPRVGHAGTLDPFATGLLVLLAGRATRLARFLPDEPKVYEALVRFGAETGTEDPQGVVLREAPLPARAALEAAARALVGTIDQVPPTFSAKHVEGARAYELARAGIPVALPAVRVTVHALTLDACEGADDAVARCRLSVTCGGGTYVRSLARDLGRAAGSAAHLEALRRLAAGAFSLEHAVSLAAVQGGRSALAPPLDALVGYPRQELTDDEIAKVARGMDVEARVDGAHAALVRAPGATTEPSLVALAERRPSDRGDRWQPRVVLCDA